MVRTLDLAKRTAILTAAKTIITKDGYAAAKMSDIAAEAGVAPGTLYLYFENKEALASAIGEEFFAKLISEFGAIFQNLEDPDGIVAIVDWAARIAERDRDVLAMAKERVSNPQSKHEHRQRIISELAEILSNLMSRGIIRPYDDAKALADMILATMRRVIMARAVFDDENIDVLKLAAITMLQHALFDDVTVAANRLLKRRQQGDV
jgi:AcrR family transcriptional regulator